jgi:hypothetical protein
MVVVDRRRRGASSRVRVVTGIMASYFGFVCLVLCIPALETSHHGGPGGFGCGMARATAEHFVCIVSMCLLRYQL